MEPVETDREFPKSAGILFGLGLGGFFAGIVLHQLLQRHHRLTSFGYPADNVRNVFFTPARTFSSGGYQACRWLVPTERWRTGDA